MFYPLRTAITPDGDDDDHPRALTAAPFQGLADVPPALAWFTHGQNPRTLDAYQLDLQDFRRVTELEPPEAFRRITRAHLIAWRDHGTHSEAFDPCRLTSSPRSVDCGSVGHRGFGCLSDRN